MRDRITETLDHALGTAHPQEQTALEFLAARMRLEARRHRDRCWGISSDALALYGVGQAQEPTVRNYPADVSDLAACERTWLMAPDEARARMLPVLEKYRRYVQDKWAKYDAEEATRG